MRKEQLETTAANGYGFGNQNVFVKKKRKKVNCLTIEVTNRSLDALLQSTSSLLFLSAYSCCWQLGCWQMLPAPGCARNFASLPSFPLLSTTMPGSPRLLCPSHARAWLVRNQTQAQQAGIAAGSFPGRADPSGGRSPPLARSLALIVVFLHHRLYFDLKGRGSN